MKKQTEKRSKVVIYKVNSDGHSRLQAGCVKWNAHSDKKFLKSSKNF